MSAVLSLAEPSLKVGNLAFEIRNEMSRGKMRGKLVLALLVEVYIGLWQTCQSIIPSR